jgi:hypothetical protein
MQNHIYALIEVESRVKFYIGQTRREPRTRLSEHKAAARTYAEGDELKYKYASALDALNIEWTMEILHIVDLGPNDPYNHDDVEDFYVNKYRVEPLQNMRSGNNGPWCGVDYNSIEAFLAAKQQSIDAIKPVHRVAVKPAKFDADSMLYSFESPHKKFVAPAFKSLAKRFKR